LAKVREVRQRLMQEIEGLSKEKMEVVADFAAFVRGREEWLDTLEILSNKELIQAIRSSREAWSQGKCSEFLSLNELNHPAR